MGLVAGHQLHDAYTQISADIGVRITPASGLLHFKIRYYIIYFGVTVKQ